MAIKYNLYLIVNYFYSRAVVNETFLTVVVKNINFVALVLSRLDGR